MLVQKGGGGGVITQTIAITNVMPTYFSHLEVAI
jgi:hypothetical protein